MLKIQDKKLKIIGLVLLILLIPVIVPLISTLIEIILNFGRYIGTISREVSSCL